MDSILHRKANTAARHCLWLVALPAGLTLHSVSAQSVGVRIAIELRADSPQTLNAWRRVQGWDLDAPVCVRSTVASNGRATTVPLSEAAARRLRRTYVLDERAPGEGDRWLPLLVSEVGQALLVPCVPAPHGDR